MRLVKLLLIFTILSVPLGQLGRIPGLPEGVGIYVTDVLVAMTVVWWVAHSLAVKRSLKIPKLGFYILAFAFIALLSLVNGARYLESVAEVLVSASYLLRWIIYAGLYFVVADTQTHLKGVFGKVLIVSGVVLALAGFVQLALFPDWSLFLAYGWDPHKNRLLSTFFDPNFTGIYLVLTINLLFGWRISAGGVKPPASGGAGAPIWCFYAGLLVCGTALVLTFSRSAWLAMAVSIFVWGVFKSRKLLIGALLIGFLAYFAVPRVQTRIAGGTDPDDSARLRFQSWSNTLQIAKEHPVLGVGFNTFRYAQAREGLFDWRQPLGGHAGAGSDSSLLLVFATTGILGFLSYLGILGRIGVVGLQSRAILKLSVLAALLVNSLFINSLFYPPIMLFFWFML
jgi:O-antigen ligase